MKQLTLSILAIFLLINSIFSQQIPEFQFTLYAMDYFGNIDSVVIGYDSTASLHDTTDTQFGEINITNVPFDSIFEMRVSPFNDDPNSSYPHENFQSKKEIAKWTCQETRNYIFSAAFISIRSKNLPIRFEWDKDKFQDTCNHAFAFSEFYEWGLLWNWGQVPHHDLETNGYHVFYNNIIPHAPYNVYEAPIEGGGIDTIYGLTLFIGKEDAIGFVSTSSVETDLVAKVFPNPASETLQLKIPTEFIKAKTVRVFNINGQEMHHQPIQNYEMDFNISEYSSGIYIYAIENEAGKVIRGKFLKI